MERVLTIAELERLVARLLCRHGLSPEDAGIVARSITAAEADGALSHGIARLPAYIRCLQNGWVNSTARPVAKSAAPGLVQIDGQNGFAQIALAQSDELLRQKVDEGGIAALGVSNCHHLAALWPDIEPYAAAGLVALTMVSTRKLMAAWDGKASVLGTNPLAFATPRRRELPLVWDQASSVISHGDVILHAEKGSLLPLGAALGADGRPTTNPRDVLEGGALLPAGGAKGSAVALMVEVLAAVMAGGGASSEKIDRDTLSAAGSAKVGQFLLLVDPVKLGDSGFIDRVETVISGLHDGGVTRLPGDRRYATRHISKTKGIPVVQSAYDLLVGTDESAHCSAIESIDKQAVDGGGGLPV